MSLEKLANMLRQELSYAEKGDDDCLMFDVAEIREFASALEQAVFMKDALEMIAGTRQCVDNLMSDKDIAREALKRVTP